MKKFLFAIILTAGFGLAAQAQSTSVASENEATPAKVEVAGQVSTESAAPQPAAVNATETAAPAKSCCSSKKGKDTASAV